MPKDKLTQPSEDQNPDELPAKEAKKVVASSLPQGPYKPKRINVVGPGGKAVAVPTKNDAQEEVLSDKLDDSLLNDQVTDEAVDDIAENESDTILAIEDARRDRRAQLVNQQSNWKDKLKNVLKNKWTWSAVALLLIIIFALPFSRYAIIGLIIKEPADLMVIDSRTDTPISNVMVKMDGKIAKTDAEGKAQLKVGVGSHTVLISKQYYKSLSESYFVSFKHSSKTQSYKLIATGRLVPVTVLNRISGQPIVGAELKLKGTTAKTNKQGEATVALPTTASSYPASLTLNGYNNSNITVAVTNQVIKANTFQLTPAGHIYYLSNTSGTIDLDEANLDGTNTSTVLAGTGQENPTTTRLLASSDWRYLVLESSRAGGQPALYLINTSNNKVTEFDNSGGNISLIGWYGHYFMYDLVNPSDPNWQNGREEIKSYDADNMQLNELDENKAEGSAGSYAYQTFTNINIVNGSVVYSTVWNTDGTSYNTTGSNDTIRSVSPNGQNKKDVQSFPVSTIGNIKAQPYSPQAVYFAVTDNGGNTTYYSYDNQSVQSSGISSSTFNGIYPTYYLSPNNNQTFWSQILDGQVAFFTGNSSAGSKKQIASLDDYASFGWYGNSYILLTRSGRLYIMSNIGLKGDQQPYEISSYTEP